MTRRKDFGITLALLALVLAWDASGLDLAVVRGWGDGHGFAWRDHWLTSRLLHDGGRWAAGVVLLALAVHALRPFAGELGRGERVHWLLVTLATLLLVPLLKHASRTSCPWELAEFGGLAQHVSHWALGIGDGGPGHCFPSGHASSAFAFVGGWFALRDRHPQAARLWLATVVACGVLLGAAQTVRGAHYPSHTLWTAWLCWALAAAAAAARTSRAVPGR